MFFAFSFGMILSNLIAQKRESQQTVELAPLFIYKGIDKQLSDISEPLQAKLERVSRERQYLLELAAIEMHIHQEAHKQGISLEAASEKLLPIASVSDEEISSFYTENKQSLDRPFYEVKDAITRRLQQTKVEQSKRELLASLIQRGDLAFSMQ